MSLVLIVEDDPAILRGLDYNLRLERHEVLTATDGETGYRMATQSKPDLAILDLDAAEDERF
jgi:DNA-binding response OmpR family regulator